MFPVAGVVERARLLTLDSGGVRWTDDEIVAWLNDGQTEIVNLKPTAYTFFGELPLATGVYQELPDGALLLLNISHNKDGNACTLLKREDLDAILPGWPSMTPEESADHYLIDDDDPKHYFVCPPNNGDGILMGRYSLLPPEIANVEANCELAGEYAPILLKYLMYRIWSKQSSSQENQRLARTELEGFFNALGVKIQSLTTYSPMRNHESAVNGPNSL